MTTLRVLTQSQLDEYLQNGYLTVPGVFPASDMDRALEACDQLMYGMDFAAWSARVASGEPLPLRGEGVGELFPTGVAELDRLVENQTYLDIACDLLGTEDIHYINGHLFVRSGPIDKRYGDQPWQGYHIDRHSASFLPPHTDPGRHDYIGSGVFLHDVDAGCAPTVMIPGSHRLIPGILPRLAKEGLFHPPCSFTDIRAVPEFAPRGNITGTKGSASFNCTNLVHGAVPFLDRSQQRAWWTMSFGRRAEALENRLGNVFTYEKRAQGIPFWVKTTARVRSLFGWPKPGDSYYNPETLALLAMWYPGMDLSAYHAALPAALHTAAAQHTRLPAPPEIPALRLKRRGQRPWTGLSGRVRRGGGSAQGGMRQRARERGGRERAASEPKRIAGQAGPGPGT